MKHPLAYVHPEAQIADNVVIEPFVTIDKNVVIEEGTRIGSNVTILEGAHIGKNCKIFPGAVISAIPQDLKFKGEKTIVEIGDNTTIRECATINIALSRMLVSWPVRSLWMTSLLSVECLPCISSYISVVT